MINVESSSNVLKPKSPVVFALVWGLTLASLSMGCGGVPRTAYYTLSAPPAPSPSEAKTSAILGVEHLRAPVALRDDRVLYYKSATQMNFYQYSRWGADPATMLTEYTAQWLGSSGAFAQVRLFPSRQRVDYTLGGSVLSFEEVDYGGATKTRVGLDLFLTRTLDHKVIWTGKQQVDAPLQGTGVEGVANALSASTSQLLREMSPGLIAQVEQDLKASTGQTH